MNSKILKITNVAQLNNKQGSLRNHGNIYCSRPKYREILNKVNSIYRPKILENEDKRNQQMRWNRFVSQYDYNYRKIHFFYKRDAIRLGFPTSPPSICPKTGKCLKCSLDYHFLSGFTSNSLVQ